MVIVKLVETADPRFNGKPGIVHHKAVDHTAE
jgi:hypothetical protein